jgi:hypothetical protein
VRPGAEEEKLMPVLFISSRKELVTIVGCGSKPAEDTVVQVARIASSKPSVPGNPRRVL